MILTEKRYYYDGTNYVVIEVKTKGTKYYRVFFYNSNLRKRLSGKCMKMLYERYKFQISPISSSFQYTPSDKIYFYSKKIRSVVYTKKGGFYYGISNSTS